MQLKTLLNNPALFGNVILQQTNKILLTVIKAKGGSTKY